MWQKVRWYIPSCMTNLFFFILLSVSVSLSIYVIFEIHVHVRYFEIVAWNNYGFMRPFVCCGQSVLLSCSLFYWRSNFSFLLHVFHIINWCISKSANRPLTADMMHDWNDWTTFLHPSWDTNLKRIEKCKQQSHATNNITVIPPHALIRRR